MGDKEEQEEKEEYLLKDQIASRSITFIDRIFYNSLYDTGRLHR